MSVAFPRLAVVSPSTDRTVYLVRKLVPNAKEDDLEIPKVAVAMGFAAGGGLELAKLAGLSGGDARGLVATATANLAKGPREWSVIEKSGLIFKKPSMLRAIGDTGVPVTSMSTDGMGVDDLSSDLLLDQTFMARACEMLGGAELIAAVPKRGWLVVGRCSPGQFPVMLKFEQLAEGIASRAGSHALATACFFVLAGKLHGISGKGYVSLVTRTENPWNLE